MLNVCVLTGRLTADPELKTTDNQTYVVSFSLAVQRNYKNKDNDQYPTDFINCVAWRNTAEFIAGYFKKGSMMTVEGSLESRKFTDKDGNNRTAYEVKVNHAYFGDSGRRQDGGAQGSGQPAEFEPDFGSDDDGDLPF